MTEILGRLRVQNCSYYVHIVCTKIAHFWYFLCHCFVFLHNSIRISIPWLFRTYFDTKIFSKCNFRTHYNVGSSTILIKSLEFRNNSTTTVTSTSNLLWKLWTLVSCRLRFVIILFRSGLAIRGYKELYRKTNRCRNSGTIEEACASVKNNRRENVKLISTNFKDIFKS